MAVLKFDLTPKRLMKLYHVRAYERDDGNHLLEARADEWCTVDKLIAGVASGRLQLYRLPPLTFRRRAAPVLVAAVATAVAMGYPGLIGPIGEGWQHWGHGRGRKRQGRAHGMALLLGCSRRSVLHAQEEAEGDPRRRQGWIMAVRRFRGFLVDHAAGNGPCAGSGRLVVYKRGAECPTCQQSVGVRGGRQQVNVWLPGPRLWPLLAGDLGRKKVQPVRRPTSQSLRDREVSE
ncbi:MAG: hypothetical protein ACRDH5_00805, partial [bacterium]